MATPRFSPLTGSPAPGFPANPSSSAFPDPAHPGPAHPELEGGEALNADPWLWDRLYSLRRCRQNFAGVSDDYRTGVGSVLLGRLLGVIVAAPELWCVEPRVLGGFGAEVRSRGRGSASVTCGAARGGGRGSLAHGRAPAVIQHLRPGRRGKLGSRGDLSRGFSTSHGVQALLPRPARHPRPSVYFSG